MKTITATGGPLDGKTVTVPDTHETFTHHADDAGHYKVNQKTAKWVPNKGVPAEKPAE